MIEDTLEDKARLERALAGIEEFMKTPAYSEYLTSERESLAGIELSILEAPPNDLPSLFLSLQNHGARAVVLQNLRTFENASASLKARIDKLADTEQQSTQQPNL